MRLDGDETDAGALSPLFFIRTDNGAYYYYMTEPGVTYQDTLLDVLDTARANNIPYRSVQIDSW
jgi:hypothetical protein